MITIKYSPQRMKTNLSVGAIIAGLGLLCYVMSFFLGGVVSYFAKLIGIAQLVAGIFMLGIYFYEKRKQYVRITGDRIIKNTLFPGELQLDKIISVEVLEGRYTLRTEEDDITINIQYIDRESLDKLNKVIEELGVEVV